MMLIDVDLPTGWRRLEAAGCSLLAFCFCSPADAGAGQSGAIEGDLSWPTSDALPTTVNGLDILDPITDGPTRRNLSALPWVSSLFAVEYPSQDVLAGIEGLDIIDDALISVSGREAARMDVTYRNAGAAMFARRWVIVDGPRTLEIAATCPLDHYHRCIEMFNGLESRIRLAA